MAVMRCAGEECERPISVSVAPEGNPLAAALGMCSDYRCCEQCGRFWCEDCRPIRCAACDHDLAEPAPKHAFAVMMGVWGRDALARIDLRLRS